MGSFRGKGSPPVRRSLKVGILDLIARKPVRSAYTRLMYPNFASIMPQAVGVWAEQLGHEVHYVTYTGLEDLPPKFPDTASLGSSERKASSPSSAGRTRGPILVTPGTTSITSSASPTGP
jgi:hypothetical protein